MSTTDDLWLEFLGGDPPIHCGLCGNSGVVDTVGKVATPNGVPCGVRVFCICPNGRVQKSHTEAPPHTAGEMVISDPDFDDKIQYEGVEDTHDCGCSISPTDATSIATRPR